MKTIQDVRGFWNHSPCNIFHSPLPVGTFDYFNQVENRKYFVESHIPEFAGFHPNWWRQTGWFTREILEIGCGIGTDTISFARNGSIITAVDLSERSLDIAKKRAKIFGYDAVIKFYKANVEELSLVIPEKKYNLIYSFGVLHHTPNPSKALEQIKTFMDEKSELRIMVYAKWSYKVLWMILKYRSFDLDKIIPMYSEAQTGCPVTYAYSKKQARELLKDFDILSIKKDHIFPYKIEDYKKYRYNKEWYFKIMPKFIFKWLERTFGWHLLIVAKLKSI